MCLFTVRYLWHNIYAIMLCQHTSNNNGLIRSQTNVDIGLYIECVTSERACVTSLRIIILHYKDDGNDSGLALDDVARDDNNFSVLSHRPPFEDN